MTVPTTIEMVRDLLPGAPNPPITDAYIQRQIDYGLTAIDTAIVAAEATASYYASKTDYKIGSFSSSSSQKSETWMKIKKNLIFRKNTGSGLPPDGSEDAALGVGGGVSTGSSRDEMQQRADNPDRTDNQFELGQFDNPTTSPQGDTNGNLRNDCSR